MCRPIYAFSVTFRGRLDMSAFLCHASFTFCIQKGPVWKCALIFLRVVYMIFKVRLNVPQQSSSHIVAIKAQTDSQLKFKIPSHIVLLRTVSKSDIEPNEVIH